MTRILPPRAGLCLMVVGLLALPQAVLAQGEGGRPGGRPGGQRGRGGMRSLVGQIENITDTELTLLVHGGPRPGGDRPGGGQGRPGARQDQGQGRSVTIALSDQTAYLELTDGSEDDIQLGMAIAAVGEGDRDVIDAKAIATYKAIANDDERRGVMMRLFMTMPRLMAELGQRERGKRPPMAFGTVKSIAPLVIEAMSREGTREVDVEIGDNTKLFKLNDIKHGDLVKGRYAVVQLRMQGRPGGGGGGARQNEPQQRKPQAMAVMQMESMPRRSGRGGPPPAQ